MANPNFEVPSKDEVEREKAPDVKSAIGKRSQNKDVDMIMPGDRYAEMGNILARWNEEAIAGSAEASAAETADASLAQRLGARLTSTVERFLGFEPILRSRLGWTTSAPSLRHSQAG